MPSKPDKPDIVALLREADEADIRRRLDQIDAERDALRTLLRSVRARRRANSARAEGSDAS